MKKICLNFQIHQPFRLKRYQFFNIGNHHYYFDDEANEAYIRRISQISYLPANKVLLDAIREYDGLFKVSFSISGTTLDLLELYAPETLDSFRTLADTGCVEFVAGTDAHSLASLIDKEEFVAQVNAHQAKIWEHFGVPVGKVFCNSNMIYTNDIGATVEEMGFQGVLTEGVRHILGIKSPNSIYRSATNPNLKLLLRNCKMSENIWYNYSNQSWNGFPFTPEKFVYGIEMLGPREKLVNISVDYSSFGGRQTVSTGIFDFLRYLPRAVFRKKMSFATPTELLNYQAVAPVSFVYPVSWMDDERDLSAWRGNEMQEDAISRLYALKDLVKQTHDPKIKTEWKYLQACDHFHFMSTKIHSTGPRALNHTFESPYEVFINYMDILSDFTLRLQEENTSIQKVRTEKMEQILISG